MKIYAFVEKGMGKTECQDRVLVGDTILAGGFLESEYEGDGNLLVAVADGVGGYQGGERASLMAVDSIRVLNRRTNLIEEDIKGLLERTNAQIMKTGQMNPGYSSMATTLTALVMNREKAVSIHIGNCRLCSFKRYLQPITKDHTRVAEMVSRGEMTEEEALTSPIRNQISACFGGNREGLFDKLQVEVQEGMTEQDNNLILTCDGIHDYVSEEDLEDILSENSKAAEVCKKIAGLARSKGSTDDISIIIIDRLGKYE